MIQLIILNENDEWRELDIKDVDIVLHKAFQNLEDPSAIESAYTLNVNLPFTKYNNEILGDIYTLDFSLPPGNYEFDQRKRYKFNLLHDDEILYKGDFVLNYIIIDADQSKNIYNATLYDEMFSVFKKLDYTLTSLAENSLDSVEYNLLPKTYNLDRFNFRTTLKNASDSWSYGAQIESLLNGEILKPDLVDNDLYKFGGYIPTDVHDPELDYTKFFLPIDGYDGYVEKFTDLIASPSITENRFETWKLYHLKPYIYYRNYLEFLFAEIYRTTGYKVKRTSKFFQFNNPYWSSLIITGNYLDKNKVWSIIQGSLEYSITYDGVSGYPENEIFYDGSRSDRIFFDSDTSTVFDLDWINNSNKKRINLTFNTSLLYKKPTTLFDSKYKFRLNHNNYIYSFIKIEFYNGTTPITWPNDLRPVDPENPISYLSNGFKKRLVLLSNNCNIESDDRDGVNSDDLKVYINDAEIHLADMNGSAVSWPDKISYTFPTTYTPFKTFGSSSVIELTEEQVTYLINNGANKYKITLSPFKSIRSRSWTRGNTNGVGFYGVLSTSVESLDRANFNMRTLFGDEFNILKGFTDFLKIFNLVCKVDYVTKEIIVNEKGEYFSDWRDNYFDWSDYIDFTDISKTNIVSNYKELVYNYEYRPTLYNYYKFKDEEITNDSFIYKTPFTANNDSKVYLEGLNNSYITDKGSTPEFFFWDELSDRYLPKDKKPIVYVDNDINGEALEQVNSQLLFRNESDFPCSAFVSSDEDTNYPVICLDTPYEEEKGKLYLPLILTTDNNFDFCINPRHYPNISAILPDSVRPDAELDFNVWKKAVSGSKGYLSEWKSHKNGYSYIDDVSNYRGIYDCFHHNWNELIYNSENQLIEATFYLPIHEYKNFDFNRLIIIENNVYMLVEITEYSFNNEVMKAVLLQIRQPNLLDSLDEEFREEYLKVSPTINLIPKTGNKTILLKVVSSLPFTLQKEARTWSNSMWFDMRTTGIWSHDHAGFWPAGEHTFTIEFITHEDDASINIYPADEVIGRAITVVQWTSDEPVDPDREVGYYKYVYAQSVVDFEYTGFLSVNPNHIIVPNESGTRITQNFNINSDSTPIVNLIPTIPPVIDNVSIGAVVNTGPRTYSVSVSYDSTFGTPGQVQIINVSNITTTVSAPITFERDYKHEEEITVFNGNNPYFWTWDWTTRSEDECAISEYPFELRCNFRWAIKEWWDTLIDHDNGEATYSEFCKGDIYIIDEDSGTAWYHGMDIEGLANRIYRLKVVYPRRYGSANDPTTNAFLRLICRDSHAYEKRIRVIANILNNT